MTSVIFVHPDGRRQICDAQLGQSLMQVAVANGISEIVAECGGNAMCATCHVYIDEGWRDILPPMDEGEDALLDGTAAERTSGSRLSCQLKLSTDLDGIEIKLPERQV